MTPEKRPLVVLLHSLAGVFKVQGEIIDLNGFI